MSTWVRVICITVGVLLVVGIIVRSITWAVLVSKRPLPPELKLLDWWEHTVIYQIYPRSFKDSDGDGIGDLKGVTSELQHFVNAGVGTIWMSPIFKSPMVDLGYDIRDFYDIHEEYGTMEDFVEMVEKAHALGLRVLLDFVPNHASEESEYFKKSVKRDPEYENFFVWADPRPDPNNASNRLVPSNWISLFGGSMWEWHEVRQQFYLHQFAVEQPDFNLREPRVRQELLNIMKFWIDKGADGFRLDALPYLFEANPDDHGGLYPNEPLSGNTFLSPDQVSSTTQEHIRNRMELYDLVYEWRDANDKWQKESGSETVILLGEAYTDIYRTMLYYGDEKLRLGNYFPFNFDFITQLSASSTARDFVYIILRWLTYMPNGHVANWVFGNHDHKRMPTRFRPDMVDGLNSLAMLLPGVAVTYQGEEIGMKDGYVSWEDTVDVKAINLGNSDNYLEFSRDPIRTPYHWNNSTSAGFSTSTKTWLPVSEDYMKLNLQKQKEAERSHFKVYQAMTKLRREPTLSHGEYHVEALSNQTMVLVRHLITHNTYSVVFNVGNAPDTADLARVPFLKEPVTVYTSSAHSTRVAEDSITLGDIILQGGEAIVIRSRPTT